MTYVISDLHGCYDEFIALIKKINFSKSDKMYILGDNIDRGTQPIQILKFIYENDNIIPLLGNHETYLLDYIEDSSYFHGWMLEGGNITKSEIDKLYKKDRVLYNNITDYLYSWPYYHVLDNYILSHAGYDLKEVRHLTNPENSIESILTKIPKEKFLTSKDEFHGCPGIPQYTTIFGHISTDLLRIWHHQPLLNNSIWFDERYKDKIGIDGGLIFGQQLNCLNLDTMETTNIKKIR